MKLTNRCVRGQAKASAREPTRALLLLLLVFKHSYKWDRQAPGGDVDGGLRELFLWLPRSVPDILNSTTFQWMQIDRDAHITLVWGHLRNTGEWCNSAGCSMVCCDTAQAGTLLARHSQNTISAATSVLSSRSCSRSVQTMSINARLLVKWSEKGVMLPLFILGILFPSHAKRL